MMKNDSLIGRRNFLKIAGSSLLSLPINPLLRLKSIKPIGNLPRLSQIEIPSSLREIIQLIPSVRVSSDGFLWYVDQLHHEERKARIVQTQWNQERNSYYERLFPDMSWGIVLHWFGTTFLGAKSLEGYLRGFDGLRQVEGYQTRTSAHFLVGDAELESNDAVTGDRLTIVQTQLPDQDGTPFVASHLSGIDLEAHKQKQQ